MRNYRPLIVASLFGSLIIGFIFVWFGYDNMFWFGALGAIIAGIVLFNYDKDKKDEKFSLFNKFIINYIKANNVSPSKEYFSDTGLAKIIFDHDSRIIHLISDYNDNKIVKEINYDSIMESQLIENGTTLTKTSRGNQLAGAMVGGLVAGGVGAIVGGLSANTTSTSTIKNIDIKIVVNDLSSPVETFKIKDSINVFDQDSPVYKKLHDDAYEIHKLISVIIN